MTAQKASISLAAPDDEEFVESIQIQLKVIWESKKSMGEWKILY